MADHPKARAAKRALTLFPWLALTVLVAILGAGFVGSPPVEPTAAAAGLSGVLSPGATPTGLVDPPAPAASPEDEPMRDPRVDPSLAIPSPALQPPGFPARDRFASISEACVQLTKELVPKGKGWKRGVYDYCEHRSWASSRNNVVKSKVDGTQIHDRDRPFAWKFYNRGIINGTLDPDNCSHHAIDRSIKHSRESRRLANNWPYRNGCVSRDADGEKTCSRKTPGELSPSLRGQWLDHPTEMDRFGTRGPHDNHLGTAVFWLPGCYPPEALDRNDVNASVTILRSIAICESYGCPNKQAIKRRWRNGPSRKVKKAWKAKRG